MNIRRKKFKKVCMSLIQRRKDGWCSTKINLDLSDNFKIHGINLQKEFKISQIKKKKERRQDLNEKKTAGIV